MTKWSLTFLAGGVFSISCLSLTQLPAQETTWVPIQGNVRLADGTPICAMVLANGQYMFSCDGTGAYDLGVPLDANGQITMFSFADGFAPFSVTADPDNLPPTILMQTAAPDSPLIRMSRTVECSGINQVRISDAVESHSEQPLCAMVLANGQHMFSCNEHLGRYDLTVPVDENGQVTLFGFADGFQPYSDTFSAPQCDDAGNMRIDLRGNWFASVTTPSCPGMVENGELGVGYENGEYSIGYSTSDSLDLEGCRHYGLEWCGYYRYRSAQTQLGEQDIQVGMNAFLQTCFNDVAITEAAINSSNTVILQGNALGRFFTVVLTRE